MIKAEDAKKLTALNKEKKIKEERVKTLIKIVEDQIYASIEQGVMYTIVFVLGQFKETVSEASNIFKQNGYNVEFNLSHLTIGWD